MVKEGTLDFKLINENIRYINKKAVLITEKACFVKNG
jgi:hypothetical protein